MSLPRREFLELVAAAAPLIGLAGCATTPTAQPPPDGPFIPRLAAAVKARTGNPPVIWLQAQACSGCSISLLNSAHPDVASLLTDVISLTFHQNMMAGTGDVALDVLAQTAREERKKFILVIEGAIPSAGGAICTMGEEAHKPRSLESWIKQLGRQARAVVAVGACATFGGIPAASGNKTRAVPLSAVLPKTAVVKIPGCPPHPDWIVGTLAHVLLYGLPELDKHGRPSMFFGKLVHDRCQRRAAHEAKQFADAFSKPGCLLKLGCKGPETHCDCPVRGWNSSVNWCVQSGAPCHGCTEPTFPDHDGRGLYAT